MGRRFLLASAGLLCLAAVTGCSENLQSIYREAPLPANRALVTDAKQRVLWSTPSEAALRAAEARQRGGTSGDYDYGLVGHNEPGQIVCAEPSPDVTQAISEAVKLAASVDLSKTGAVDVGGQSGKAIGFDFGRSVTAAVAQLGERLATIQLMRDKMYRACEAYANGAINATTYTTVMARLDKTMMSLLSGELAAGAFGRELAKLGGAAHARGGSAAEIAEKSKKLENAIKEAMQKQTDFDTAPKGNTPEDPNSWPQATKDKKTAADEAKAKLPGLQEELAKAALSGLDLGTASLASGAGGLSGSRPSSADAVVEIHRNYVDDDGLDAMVDACIANLDYTGPLHARLVGSDVRRDFAPYFNALVGTASAESTGRRALEEKYRVKSAAMNAAQGEEEAAKRTMDARHAALKTSVEALERASERVAEARAREKLTQGLPEGHAARKQAEEELKAAEGVAKVAEGRVSADSSDWEKAQSAFNGRQQTSGVLRQELLLLLQEMNSSGLRLEELGRKTEEYARTVREATRASLDYRMPMLQQCQQIIQFAFAKSRMDQEVYLRQIDRDEKLRKEPDDRLNAFSECAEAASALAKSGNEDVKKEAQAALKSCNADKNGLTRLRALSGCFKQVAAVAALPDPAGKEAPAVLKRCIGLTQISDAGSSTDGVPAAAPRTPVTKR